MDFQPLTRKKCPNSESRANPSSTVGVGGIGHHKLPPYHANFVSLLKKKYGFKIKETLFREGMAGVMQAPLNHFTLGKANFLVAGDAAGFMHNGGEGISCALTTGDLAAESILRPRRQGRTRSTAIVHSSAARSSYASTSSIHSE